MEVMQRLFCEIEPEKWERATMRGDLHRAIRVKVLVTHPVLDMAKTSWEGWLAIQ
jgi:hypothetical protein